MKLASVITAAAMGVALLAGCSDKDLSGINTDCSNLEGIFIANSATVTSTSGTPTTRNLLADSSSFDIAFGTGTFSSSYRNGGSVSNVSGSTVGATGSNLTLTQALFPGSAANNAFECSLDGDKLTLEAPTSTYVFPGESDPRPATLRVTLTRREQ